MSYGVAGAGGGDEDEVMLERSDGVDESLGDCGAREIVPVAADLGVDDDDTRAAGAETGGEVVLVSGACEDHKD